jgi:hypothetical protein
VKALLLKRKKIPTVWPKPTKRLPTSASNYNYKYICKAAFLKGGFFILCNFSFSPIKSIAYGYQEKLYKTIQFNNCGAYDEPIGCIKK